MSEEFEIRNKVAESGLINFDLTDLVPKGKERGLILKIFFYGNDFKEKISAKKWQPLMLKIIVMRMSIFTILQMRLFLFGHIF
jgi:hypothetical protein